MKENDFIDFWNKEYPEALPINHELKWMFQDRWFRIHSLPESKRYADSEDEYKILLDRQNKLFEDLIGEGEEIAISFGLYTGDDIINDNYKELTDFGEFQKVLTIDLHKERPEEYEYVMYLDLFVKIEKWEKDSRNDILKAIANDEIRAMFICPARKCIIAPYDGGVDVIVDSSEKRDKLKTKYRDWLSDREDGM
ncbi:DUF3885 domain-containing protein [Pontibacter lucknowensis]|uniref:DUF3885 domain-containing protein n=1 Tax=Pontibacter lucknowensis TaxID=1077936 RepID=A0A1N7BIG1_9BACT|nr:hypothetical protein [Pontibacter lucknowensis]SIR50984.1 hypothetical protein SAMN05421545_3974 [Pontibacter lucknowensis]